jgi:tripartite-type tricarboxylate transporter receptor subunit TctC
MQPIASMGRWAAALAAVVVLSIAGLAAPPAAAQPWPSKPITTIVPLGAGSASDIMARVVMEQVSKQVGQTIVVENRPGAGGTIGANLVAKAAPDGYTVLAYGALAIAHALYSKLPYDTLKDFAPVVPFGQQPLVVVTAPGKYRTLAELIAAAKANPGALNYSTAGVGSASHFAAERLFASAGIKAQHIPFKGAVEAVTEVMAGRADFSIQLFTTSLAQINEGKLVALAVSAEKRAGLMPQVPTMIEAGLKADAVYPFWSGLFLPAQTPRDIVARLHDEAAKALMDAAVRERLAKLSVEPMPMSVAQFEQFFRADVAGNVKLVREANIPRQ